MFNIITKLFGGTSTAKAATNLVADSIRGIGSFIDEQQFTPQEKAEFAREWNKHFLELNAQLTKENSVRSVTRRIMAWGIVGFTLLNAQIAVYFSIKGEKEVVNAMLSVVQSFNLDWAFVSVCVLYFGVQFFRTDQK